VIITSISAFIFHIVVYNVLVYPSYLSKNGSNIMHYIMLLKSSYTNKLYCNMFWWWPQPLSGNFIS